MKVTVCDLITNKHTQFTESDREWLSALNESQLATMMPVDIPEVVANQEVKAPTYEELLAAAPVEVRAQHDFVANMVKKNRDSLIGRIKANSSNKLTDGQLASMSDDMLQATADSIAPVVNYAAAAGVFTQNVSPTEEVMGMPDHSIGK